MHVCVSIVWTSPHLVIAWLQMESGLCLLGWLRSAAPSADNPVPRDGEFVTHRHTHHDFAYIAVQCTVAQLPLWGWYPRSGSLGRRCWSDATRAKTFPPCLCSPWQLGFCLRVRNLRALDHGSGLAHWLAHPLWRSFKPTDTWVFAAPSIGHSPPCHLLCPFLHAPGGCLTWRHEMCGRFSGSEQ